LYCAILKDAAVATDEAGRRKFVSFFTSGAHCPLKV
jgi:hypothetical protein